MIDIYRMINRIMVGRRWITPEVSDYRLDRTEGLDVGSLPAVPKVEGQLSDAHAYFEQGVSEPADLGEYRQRFASRYSWAIPTLYRFWKRFDVGRQTVSSTSGQAPGTGARY